MRLLMRDASFPKALIDFSLTMEREVDPVYSLSPSPDPSWRNTCICGTEHGYSVITGWLNVEVVVDETETYYCEDCREEHTFDVWHRVCITCGCRLQPRFLPPDIPLMVPGFQSATLTVQWVEGQWLHKTEIPLTSEEHAAFTEADKGDRPAWALARARRALDEGWLVSTTMR